MTTRWHSRPTRVCGCVRQQMSVSCVVLRPINVYGTGNHDSINIHIAAALFPLNLNHTLLKKGMGTADHLLPLSCY